MIPPGFYLWFALTCGSLIIVALTLRAKRDYERDEALGVFLDISAISAWVFWMGHVAMEVLG